MVCLVHIAGMSQGATEKCRLGKYGSLVTFKQTSPPSGAELSTEELGRQLGQHVVGMNPSRIGSVMEDPEGEQGSENAMMFQEFLLDSTMTVKEFLEQNRAQVVDFVRFECGEELEEKATELKKQQQDDARAETQAESVQ